MKLATAMPTNAIVSEPEGQKLFPQILLYHEVVRLTAELIVEVLGPDELAAVIKDHRAGVRYFPSLRRDEIEVIVSETFRAPVQKIEALDLRFCREEFLHRILAIGTGIECLIILRVEEKFCWQGCEFILGYTCRDVDEQRGEDPEEIHATADGQAMTRDCETHASTLYRI